MLQTIIVTLLVLAAAIYAARSLLPRRWLRRAGGAQASRDEGSSCKSCRK